MACSKIAPNRYLDQFNKKIYSVDHLAGEIVSTEDANLELIDTVE
jgi:hypothetical protein